MNYLRSLQKGSHVYVEANYEIREPDRLADPSTPQGQRQVVLRHGTCSLSCLLHSYLTPPTENIRLLRGPHHAREESTEETAVEESL